MNVYTFHLVVAMVFDSCAVVSADKDNTTNSEPFVCETSTLG